MMDVPTRSQVVVVGGGIVGVAAAYHLAQRGWTDVVVVERKSLTSGTTWHAAGLIAQSRPTEGLTRMVSNSLEVFADLERRVGIGYQQNGTIRLAATAERLEELLRAADRAMVYGIEAVPLNPEQLVERHPLIDASGLVGGVLWPNDGRGNASDATLAMAKLAKASGVRFLEHTPVESVIIENGLARGVRTSRGDIEAEFVINATGMWGNNLGRGHSAHLPLLALQHYYLVTENIDGLGGTLPNISSYDDFAYVKAEGGGLLVGFFEPGGKPWSPSGIPDDAEFATAPGDWDHLMPYFERIAARLPVLQDVGVRLFFCGPESFTPDGLPHLGEVPGIRNYLAAVGFNSYGFLSGPGAGRYLADWVVDGYPPYPLTETDPRRVMPFQVNPRYLVERATETLGGSFGIHWPFEQRETARGIRRSPIHDRLADQGAVFGESAGWERANWFATGGVERRYEYSFGRQNWFPCWKREHDAVRQGVGLLDLSGFGKILVRGGQATALLQRVCANNVDVVEGRSVYTQWLNPRAGIEGDVTVTRLGPDRHLVLTAGATVRRDVDWLERNTAQAEFVAVDDISSAFAMFVVVGPLSRAVLATVTDSDLSNGSFPFGASREINIGHATARATRRSFVGELGWELLVPTEMATHVYEALVSSGQEHEMAHIGYHALNSLRLEKGYRSWGHDIGPDISPLEAGLGYVVDWSKEFVGKQALAHERDNGLRRRRLQLRLHDPDAMIYHDEPVLRDGTIVGRVTSAAYGHTLGASVGIALVTNTTDAPLEDWIAGGIWQVRVAGKPIRADVSLQPFYDPTSSRVRDVM